VPGDQPGGEADRDAHRDRDDEQRESRRARDADEHEREEFEQQRHEQRQHDGAGPADNLTEARLDDTEEHHADTERTQQRGRYHYR
jgi:hypothetical protein